MEVVSWGSSARLVNQWCVVVAASNHRFNSHLRANINRSPFQLAHTCEYQQKIIAGRDDPRTKEKPAIAGTSHCV